MWEFLSDYAGYILALLAYAGACYVTEVYRTPLKPKPDAPLKTKLWYAFYMLAERVRWVGEKTKQNPALGVQVAALAQAMKDGTATVEGTVTTLETVAKTLGAPPPRPDV